MALSPFDYTSEGIEELVAKVAQRVGVSKPAVVVFPPWQSDVSPVAASYSDKIDAYRVEVYTSRLDAFQNQEQFEAGIAHELGHITLDHSKKALEVTRRHETEADVFAARHGYAEALESYFASNGANFDPNDKTHPNPAARVRSIKRAIGSV